MLSRTWIDIDLDALLRNYRSACSLTESKVTCVLKSNAYGLGAVEIARALQQEGCSSFAVSCIREGLELRQAGITGEILNMGMGEPYLLKAAVLSEIILTASSTEELLAIQEAAAAAGKRATVHLKADTGLHRLGFDVMEEADTAAKQIAALLPELTMVDLAGLFSHLGLINTQRDHEQNDRLLAFRDALKKQGIIIRDLHLCDSIGLVRYPEWHYSRVRVGAILYGVRPSRSEHLPFTCEEPLVFRTVVSQLHWVKKGDTLGYSDDMYMEQDTLVATLPVGFGDGYPRHLSNGLGKVLIHGQLAPVMGIIMMDQMMVDVTHIPGVKAGDAVSLIGGGISYWDYADWCHTNRNEGITILSRRPLRVYRRDGKIVKVLDQLTGLE